jgi:peptidylprolyl isomerase
MLGLVSLTFFNQRPVVVNGDNITVRYTGWIRNHTFKSNTVSFIVGNGDVIKGLDIGVIGMYEGGSKNLSIPPSLAYGTYDPYRVYGVPVGFFEAENVSLPSIGRELLLDDVDGRVINVTDQYVVVDTNHPLAGEEINMTVEVLRVIRR